MKDFYYTSSLNIGAWLLAHNFKIIKTVKLNNVVLYFNRTKELEECINEYNNNINLKRFITSFKEIKKIIKEIK